MACKPDSEGACLRPLEGLLLHHLKLAVWLEGGNDVRQWRWGRMHHFSIPKWAQCHRNSAALLRGHRRPGGKMMDELPSSLSCLTTVYTHTHTLAHKLKHAFKVREMHWQYTHTKTMRTVQDVHKKASADIHGFMHTCTGTVHIHTHQYAHARPSGDTHTHTHIQTHTHKHTLWVIYLCPHD